MQRTSLSRGPFGRTYTPHGLYLILCINSSTPHPTGFFSLVCTASRRTAINLPQLRLPSSPALPRTLFVVSLSLPRASLGLLVVPACPSSPRCACLLQTRASSQLAVGLCLPCCWLPPLPLLLPPPAVIRAATTAPSPRSDLDTKRYRTFWLLGAHVPCAGDALRSHCAVAVLDSIYLLRLRLNPNCPHLNQLHSESYIAFWPFCFRPFTRILGSASATSPILADSIPGSHPRLLPSCYRAEGDVEGLLWLPS